MEIPASHQNTNLPLSWRLRRAALIALLLGLWAPCKIMWEQSINRASKVPDALCATLAAPVTARSPRPTWTGSVPGGVGRHEQCGGQTSVLAVINVTVAWDAARTGSRMAAVVDHPRRHRVAASRASIFWDMGGWQLWRGTPSDLGREDVTRRSSQRAAAAQGLALLGSSRGPRRLPARPSKTIRRTGNSGSTRPWSTSSG